MRYIISGSICLSVLLCLQAESRAAEVISSLCATKTIAKLECQDDDRDCVFKTTTLITDFLNDYEIPALTNIPGLRYPEKCIYRSHKEEAVNIVFDVSPKGKVINVRVLNSSNNCFDRKARNYARRFAFKSSADGFECLPVSAKFKRPPVSDSTGNSY